MTKPSGKVMVRTPNGHNIFFFSIEPLDEEVYDAIINDEIPEERMKRELSKLG